MPKYSAIWGIVDGEKRFCLCCFGRLDYLILSHNGFKLFEHRSGDKADFESNRVSRDAAYSIDCEDDEKAKQFFLDMCDLKFGNDTYSDIVGGK